jgi:uncharacterized protein (DUF1778 family)
MSLHCAKHNSILFDLHDKSAIQRPPAVDALSAGFKSFVEAIDAPTKNNMKMLEVLRRQSKWDNL